MRFAPTAIPGMVEIEVEPLGDARGGFARLYDEQEFAAHGIPTAWPQWNASWNETRGTLRGMHYQRAPKAEPKLVRCVRGRLYDVAVDLRPDSPAYKSWAAVELDAGRRNAVFIPAGCAHGFLTLTDECELLYHMGESFAPELGGGVRWNDPAFAIAWPFAPAVITERDRSWPDLE
jgi:dTDP-4-dehydrorhamnose 3,5-epimerase